MINPSGPLTDADIIAARTRAAESDVPWDRSKAVRDAIVSAKAKREARLRERRRRILMASVGALLFLLAILGWLLTRR